MKRVERMIGLFALTFSGMVLPLQAHASGSIAVVPEPATLALLATGLAGLGAAEYIRRRNKNKQTLHLRGDAMNRIQDVAMMFTIAVLGMALPLEAQASLAPPTVVPEPATLVMLATGLAGLGAAEFIRRRKKK